MTNGEKIKEIFPSSEVREVIEVIDDLVHYTLDGYVGNYTTKDWWNAEYKESTTKNDLGVDCISRAEAIKTIQRYGVGCFDADEFSPEECERFVIAKLNGLPPVTPQEPRWIPVSERLPNWDIQCLVTDGDGEYGVGYYCEDVHAWDSPNWGWLERKDRVDNKEAFTGPCGIRKVVAWMPLPNPYREVK